MNRMLVGSTLLGLLVYGSTAYAGTERGTTRLDKKLIEYGWDVPFTDYVRANLTSMEKRPFDGLIFKLRGGGKVLVPQAWDEKTFARDLDNLKEIQWRRFTDNFLIMWAASNQDWFNDDHWRAITNNARLMARCARIGRCVGVCFDQEPYGTDPWSYKQAAHHGTKSFAEYETMVRRRGAQFMRALESEYPGLTVLTFFQLSLFPQLLRPLNPAERAAKLSQMHYALLPAFLHGMLDAASPRVRIVDGNEGAYYYTDSRAYLEVYHRITQLGRLLVDPALWGKYRAHVRVGQALYIDQYFGLRTRKVLGTYLTSGERARWFEHNVYWALKSSDKYVWCYSERMNWWRNKDIPPGCEEAIRSARKKVAQGEPLGFDLKPIVDAGKEREHKRIMLRLNQQTAEIQRLPKDVQPPVIDGRLDDVAWAAVEHLSPFVPLATGPEKLTAQTLAWAAWDENALYIAMSCREPTPAKMHIAGARHDDPVWEGDDVEVLIAAPGGTTPFYHFALNPKGVPWDAVHRGKEADLTYNPVWRHATQQGNRYWKAELALPWAALRLKTPQPGTKLRVNLCRQRHPGHELSAWSPMVSGFLEHQLFGTWILR